MDRATGLHTNTFAGAVGNLGCINAATETINGVTNFTYQVIGENDIWEMAPTANLTTATFGNVEDLNDLVIAGTGFSGISSTWINDSGAIVGTATYTQQSPTDPIAAGSHGVMLLEVNLSCPIADTTTNFTTGYGGILPNINPAHFFQATPPDPTLFGSKEPALVIFYKDAINSSFVVQPFMVNLSFSELSGVTWAQTKGPTGTGTGTLQNASHTDAQYVNTTLGGLYQFDGTLGTSSTKVQTSLILPLAGAEIKDVVSSDITAANTFASNVLANYNPLEINLWPTNGIRWFYAGGAGDYLGRPDNQNSKTCARFNPVNDDTGSAKYGQGAVATWFGVPVRISKASNFLVAYTMEKIGVWNLNGWLAQMSGTPDDVSATASFNFGWAVAAGTKSYSSDTVTMLQANFYNTDVKNTRLWPNTASADNHVSGQAALGNVDTQFCSPEFLLMTDP